VPEQLGAGNWVETMAFVRAMNREDIPNVSELLCSCYRWLLEGETKMERCRIDFESIPWESPLKGARFKAYDQDGRRLRLVEFSRELVEPDWCRRGHIGYVLEGEMEIDFDGEVVRFGPGDGLFIPAGENNKHIARVITEVVRLIMVEDVGRTG